MTFIDFRPIKFVNGLRKQGIILTIGDDKNLLIDAPSGVLDADLLKMIREYKPEIVKRLRNENRGSVCLHCGTSDFVTVPIHSGESTRLDCAGCGRFLRFGVWNGKP